MCKDHKDHPDILLIMVVIGNRRENTKIQLERFKNGCLELAIAELPDGLKSRSLLICFVIIIQPVFMMACARSKSLFCQRLVFLSHQMGRVIFTLKGSSER